MYQRPGYAGNFDSVHAFAQGGGFCGGDCARRGDDHLPARMPKLDRFTPPQIIRDFRRHTGLSQHRLAQLLGCTDDAISGYERDGAPGWMRYALFGVGVDVIGLRADAAADLTGISPAQPALDRVPTLRIAVGREAARRPSTRPSTRIRADEPE